MKRIKVVGILLTLLAWVFVSAVIGAEKTENPPLIENFTMSQVSDGVKVEFSFLNVAGGLEKAQFIIGYIIERDSMPIEAEVYAGLKLRADPRIILQDGITGEDGKFKATIPLFMAKGRLNSGDKIIYFIFLIDNQGRKSNKVEHEFVFIEKWEI